VAVGEDLATILWIEVRRRFSRCSARLSTRFADCPRLVSGLSRSQVSSGSEPSFSVLFFVFDRRTVQGLFADSPPPSVQCVQNHLPKLCFAALNCGQSAYNTGQSGVHFSAAYRTYSAKFGFCFLTGRQSSNSVRTVWQFSADNPAS
jgi:hypothetical protein